MEKQPVQRWSPLALSVTQRRTMRKQLSHGKILTVLRDAIEGGEAIDMPDRAFALVSDRAGR